MALRTAILALALLAAAVPALAPPAAACHPPLLIEHQAAGAGARVFLDMGCSHMLPWRACVSAWTPSADFGMAC